MNFFKIGDWKIGKPTDSKGKLYVLTLEDKVYEKPLRIVSEHFYRYNETDNVWEIYSYTYEEWSVFAHPYLRVVAYAEFEKLKPYGEELE